MIIVHCNLLFFLRNRCALSYITILGSSPHWIPKICTTSGCFLFQPVFFPWQALGKTWTLNPCHSLRISDLKSTENWNGWISGQSGPCKYRSKVLYHQSVHVPKFHEENTIMFYMYHIDVNPFSKSSYVLYI